MIFPFSLALATMGSAALVVAMVTKRPALFLLAIAILASHAWPLVQLTDSETPLSATLTSQLATVALITFLASASWLLGYWLCARIAPRPTQSFHPDEPAPLHLHRLVLATLIGLLFAAPGGIVGFAQTGFLRLPVDSLLFSITYAFACLAALTTAILCATSAATQTRAPWASIVLVLLVFWLLGGRTQLAISALSFALIYLAHGRVRLRSLALPALAILALAVLTLTFRLTLQGETIDLWSATSLMASQLSLLEGYALSARFVEEFGKAVGHYWDTALQIVPRAIFPDKPLQLSRALRLMEARDTLGGLTPGLAGEAFVTGGLVGVSAIGIVFGATLALLDNCYLRLTTLSPLAQALTVSLVPLLAIFVLRGGFDTAVFRLIILIAAGLIGLWWRAPTAPLRRPLA